MTIDRSDLKKFCNQAIKRGHQNNQNVRIMPNPTMRWPEEPSLPKISIVTPCFNHREYIEATILSILRQGYPNLEYVIFDGGSTDGSAEVIAKYADYLTYWRSSPDEGQYEAINEGFQHTTGEIMGWLNSDDMLHRNALWTIAEIFQQCSQVDWLTGLPTAFDVKGRTVAVRDYGQWTRYGFLTGDQTMIQQESTFWRRSLWDKAGSGLKTQYRYAADFELWMRFFQFAQLYTAPILIGGFRRTPGQLSERFRDHYLGEVERILAGQPLTGEDKIALVKLKLFKRFILRIPFLGACSRIRSVYNKLLQCPLALVYNHDLESFEVI